MNSQPTQLTDRLRKILKSAETRTLEQQDADHRAWRDTNDGLVAIIKDHRLGIPPSERTWEIRRAIILDEITAMKDEE